MPADLPAPVPDRVWLRRLRKSLRYTASLPERVLRGMAVTLGGFSRGITEHLFPTTLRRTTSYRVFLGNFQRFVIEKFGRVQGVYDPDGPGLPEQYLTRATVGNVMTGVGLFAFHLSPLWVFAILSDLAHGSRRFLDALVAELHRDGLLAPDVRPTSVEELIDAIHRASDESSRHFDTPPLSREQFAAMREGVFRHYGEALQKGKDLGPTLNALWTKMLNVARVEKRPLGEIAGWLALGAAGMAKGTARGLWSLGKATKAFTLDPLFDSYGETLGAIQKEGYVAYTGRSLRPYLTALGHSFHPGEPTWTERWLERWV